MLFRDISFALRQLLRHRVYAVTAILSLALGIGATAAVYSVLYGVLIDPYPYHDANRIAFIEMHGKQGQGNQLRFTVAQLDQLRQAQSVEDVMAQDRTYMVATDGDLPLSVPVLRMTGNAFQFLGAPPILGRLFTASEAPAGSDPPPVAVISYLFWKKRFASKPDVLGKVLELNQQQYTIIGVVGPRFTWTDAEIYLPLPTDAGGSNHLNTLIRLRPGVSTDAAAEELSGIIQQIGHADPSILPPDGFRIKVESLNDGLLGEFKGTLILLFVSVGLLLLIGCGNVSILMLARGTARQQELATRLALGASRARIVRQLLTEAVLLSVTGGVLGMAFAYIAIHLITGLLPEYSIPHEVVIHLNVPVLLFSVAVSVAVGILSGISPALHFSNPHIAETIRSGSSRSATGRGDRTRSVLIAAQVALTVLMLAGAGAAMQNFLKAYAAQLGFDSHHILTMSLMLPEKAYPTWQGRVNYEDAIIEKIKATEGVASAAISVVGTPPDANWLEPVDIVGGTLDRSRKSNLNMIGAEFFSVLHIPILQGRTLTREEVARGANLAVISKNFADRYFPGTDPIGRQILPMHLSQLPPQLTLTAAPNFHQPYQIIGVVGDVRNDGLHRPILPQAYIPSSILLSNGVELLIRTAGDPLSLTHSISTNIRALNQNQAVSFVYSMDDYISTFVWSQDRFLAVLFGVFSFVALGLALIGLASVVAYTVQQRTREFGIRMALGAPHSNVLWLTLLATMRTTAIGLVLGILASVGLSDLVFRWTQSSLRDPGVLAVISAIFLLATAAACLPPARRATRINPSKALRDA